MGKDENKDNLNKKRHQNLNLINPNLRKIKKKGVNFDSEEDEN